MTSRRAEASEERCRQMLEALGCPGVRRGEGTDEWRSSQGSYTLTPDLVAGPLVGEGDPSDFYIDVFAPTGDREMPVARVRLPLGTQLPVPRYPAQTSAYGARP